jgi:hypothetical protein
MHQSSRVLAALFISLALAVPAAMVAVAPAHAADCVSRAEFRNAKAAWQMEGLTRPGVRHYFGIDGKLVRRADGVMKRRYRGCAQGVRVFVKYKHFPEAPGPTRTWWVVRMWRVVV